MLHGELLLARLDAQEMLAGAFDEHGDSLLLAAHGLEQVIQIGADARAHRDMLHVHVEFIAMQAEQLVLSDREGIIVFDFDSELADELIEAPAVIAPDQEDRLLLSDVGDHGEYVPVLSVQLVCVIAVEKVAVDDEDLEFRLAKQKKHLFSPADARTQMDIADDERVAVGHNRFIIPVKWMILPKEPWILPFSTAKQKPP